MNLTFMDLPDDPAELTGWLERRLVGLDLADLIAELSAVHGTHGDSPPLEELLGSYREGLLTGGLGSLPPRLVSQLLRQPSSLAALQELVLTEGGPYWARLVAGSTQLDEIARRGGRRLEAFLAGSTGASSDPEPVVRPMHPAVAWYRRPWVVSLATAAAVLLIVSLLPRPGTRPLPPPLPEGDGRMSVASSPPAAWGWDRPGALPSDGSASEYLTRLADAAEEWFHKRPDDAPTLARRIAELRQGCSTLIFAEHKPLSDVDRRWLVGRCRGWAARLDQERAALEAGQPIAQVRDEADATVRQMVRVLRTRAESM